MGYYLSLLLHSVVLTSAALVVIGNIDKERFGLVATTAKEEETGNGFEELIDTRFESSNDAETQPLQITEVLPTETENVIPVPDIEAGMELSATQGEGKGDGAGEDGGVSGGQPGEYFVMPESGKVVTKGSFTAWTVPEDPEPGQNYRIVIQIQLPEKVRRYRQGDLSGLVVGTDGYLQRIPPLPRAYLPVQDNKAQLVIFVQGANADVRDRIQIQSRILKEQQTLEIVF